ncbi:DoxX family membrane protein [Nakamurella antarctica]|uniref:DoxX family membrane protein n=1 Tax=Nakamurella antarctica TaxID=1902245 RepID=A0A3G8ZN03_9ACTN|nr:DoxX family membrane protein [Nakamurella antarctica]AZI58175.1 DoxX family membrane protein [Nakamurella antarctica]
MSIIAPTAPRNSSEPDLAAKPLSHWATWTLVLLRVSTGFIFLWAFLDKAFGLGYSATSAKAWINGGSPTNGFLKSVDVGPLQSTFHSIAGTWWADTLFMLGLLVVGVALILGIGLRLAAAVGILLMALMWIAEYPVARFNVAGEPTGSSNPLVDYHFLYAVALLVVAATNAGNMWGLGARWAKMSFVLKNAWLR